MQPRASECVPEAKSARARANATSEPARPESAQTATAQRKDDARETQRELCARKERTERRLSDVERDEFETRRVSARGAKEKRQSEKRKCESEKEP